MFSFLFTPFFWKAAKNKIPALGGAGIKIVKYHPSNGDDDGVRGNDERGVHVRGVHGHAECGGAVRNGSARVPVHCDDGGGGAAP